MNISKTGLKPDSVKNMIFGAGVLYKNFSFGEHFIPTFDTTPNAGKTYYYQTGGQSGSVSYTELKDSDFVSGTVYYEKYTGYGGDKIGATKEGAKVSIIPEYTDIEVDGVLVKMQGLTRKTGEKGTIEATVVDMNVQNVTTALNGSANYAGNDPITSGNVSPYITTKEDISEGDYISDLALVARRLDNNKLVIVVFRKALCTSGFEIQTKNKETAGSKFTFEAFAQQSDQNVAVLPVEVIVESNI